MSEEQSEYGTTRELPLWKHALDEMRKSGVEYGKTYAPEWFEERLSCHRDSMEFSLALSEIRRELEFDGFYLTGRGQAGNQIILPPKDNADVLLSYQRAAIDALKRGTILGTATKTDTLTVNEKRRHESVLQRVAIRAALISRRPSRELPPA